MNERLRELLESVGLQGIKEEMFEDIFDDQMEDVDFMEKVSDAFLDYYGELLAELEVEPYDGDFEELLENEEEDFEELQNMEEK